MNKDAKKTPPNKVLNSIAHSKDRTTCPCGIYPCDERMAQFMHVMCHINRMKDNNYMCLGYFFLAETIYPVSISQRRKVSLAHSL